MNTVLPPVTSGIAFQQTVMQRKKYQNTDIFFQADQTPEITLRRKIDTHLTNLKQGLDTEGVDGEKRPQSVNRLSLDDPDEMLTRGVLTHVRNIEKGYSFYVLDPNKPQNGYYGAGPSYNFYTFKGTNPAFLLFIKPPHDSRNRTEEFLSVGIEPPKKGIVPAPIRPLFLLKPLDNKEVPYIKLGPQKLPITSEEWEEHNHFFQKLNEKLTARAN